MGSGANGVNIGGTVVGSYTTDPSGAVGFHGWTYNGTSYSISVPPTSDPLHNLGTAAYDINNSGQVVGYFTDAAGNYHGFIKNASIYQTVDIAGAIATLIYGENNLGQLVGTYYDASGNEHGFLESGTAVTTVDYPGSSGTGIYGIDDAGDLTGYYLDANGDYHGFSASAVPEPTSIALLGSGFLSLLLASRSRRYGRRLRHGGRADRRPAKQSHRR